MTATTPQLVDVRDDLALVAPDGACLAPPMAPRAALELAERLTRSAFRRMLIEEAERSDAPGARLS